MQETGLNQKKGRLRAVTWVVLLALVAGWVVYAHWPALSAEAASFDDEQYLHKNKLVQNPSWRSARRFLCEVLEPSTVGGYYQPFTMLSLMVDHALGGRSDDLTVFHVTSLSLHVLNTVSIIVLLYVLFGKLWPAVLVGLLFGVHPLTVEPIPWVSERKTLLASFFALWCVILYVRYARKGDVKLLVGCAVMYVFALMAKPTTMPLAVLLLLMDFWPLRRLSWRAFFEKIPLFVIMVVSALITVISQARTAAVTMPGEYSPTRIPLTLCHNIIFYPYKILWPVNLTSHYPVPDPMALSDPMVLAGVIGTCVLLAALAVSLWWTRAPATGWVFFFVAILPTMGIIGFTNVIASDKYLYLPSVGFLMVLTWYLGRLWRDGGGVSVDRVAIVAIVIVLGVLETGATRRYLVQWENTEKFYRYMLGLAPDSWPIHLNLANTVLKMDRIDEAIQHYEKAIAIRGDHVQARYNYGVALSAGERHSDAIEEFLIVLRLKKNHQDAQFRLGTAYMKNGQLDEAIVYFNEALERKPRDVKVLNNLGMALAGKGQLIEAVTYYKQSLEINPDSKAVLNNLGNALVKLRQYDEAIKYYNLTLERSGDYADTYYNLAGAYRQMREFEKAVSNYREALRLKPDEVDAHFGLAMALAELKEYGEAIECYEKAIKLKADNALAYYNLGLVYANLNQVDKAIEQFREVLRIHPADAEMHCNVGVLLARQGRLDEAIKEFRRALELNPNLKRAQVQLDAALLEKQGGGPK